MILSWQVEYGIADSSLILIVNKNSVRSLDIV
ncbi:MAG: hypothetical protein ACJA0C_001574, partial [Candidatus Endobugula sp.]